MRFSIESIYFCS